MITATVKVIPQPAMIAYTKDHRISMLDLRKSKGAPIIVTLYSVCIFLSNVLANKYLAMKSITHSCGTVEKFLDFEQLKKSVEIFKKTNSQLGKNNHCYGIDQDHVAYLWFKKTILDHVSKHFDLDLRLIFSMLLDCTDPFDIHNDVKPLPEPGGKHCISFLIPYSVDNDINLCHHASTLIFNETDVRTDQMPDVVNNIVEIYSHINHVNTNKLTKYSLKYWAKWQPGDLIWWDSQLAHVSNNFVANGFASKQAIVAHTYVL